MGRSPLYFSETLTVGKRTYLMEVRRHSRGEKYFIIKRTDLKEEEQEPVIIYERSITRFAGAVDRAVRAVLNTVPEVDSAEERSAKKKAAAERKKDRPKNQGKRWSEDDISLLVIHYKNGMPIDELAELLGRGKFSVEVQISKLGLTRSEN